MKKKLCVLIGVVALGLALPASTLFAEEKDVAKGTTNATVSFQQGKLILDQVPAALDFGTLPVTVDTTVAKLPVNNTYTLGVTDTRGSETGYNVTVQASRMQTSDGVNKFEGNNIKFENGTPKANKLDQDGDTDNSTAPVVKASFYADATNVSGNPVPTIIQTAANHTTQGLLGWHTEWTGGNISLSVDPGEALAYTYQTTITWTLNDVPAI